MTKTEQTLIGLVMQRHTLLAKKHSYRMQIAAEKRALQKRVDAGDMEDIQTHIMNRNDISYNYYSNDLTDSLYGHLYSVKERITEIHAKISYHCKKQAVLAVVK